MDLIKTLRPGQRIRFPYLNHKDLMETRDVVFQGVQYGANEYYPKPEWFLHCYDLDRQAFRSFAVSRIAPSTVELLDLMAESAS